VCAARVLQKGEIREAANYCDAISQVALKGVCLMPTLFELRERSIDQRPFPASGRLSLDLPGEETIVSDRRSGLRPKQVIEQKLSVALRRKLSAFASERKSAAQ
jgi:hypothetical protein